MIRKIISIDEDKCTGCGLCVDACHEGALTLVDGKARLVSESYCDGLGDCLPECPTGAITIKEREAPEYDEAAVKKNMGKKLNVSGQIHHGCPGTRSKVIERNARKTVPAENHEKSPSELRQWPCQIKLVPVNAPYFNNAHLLVAADCTAFAYGSIHPDYIRNRITIIGCPKLDNTDYSEKLTAILKANEIKSITVLQMEVPCCGGIVDAVKAALVNSGKMLPWNVITIGTDGTITDD